MRSGRRRLALGLATALAVGIALRAGPIWQSPLPFNPDGIIHAVHADAATEAGSLPLESLATDDLLFTSFLATLSELFGAEPMTLAQPVIALVGVLPALVAAMATRRLAIRAGWGRSLAAFAAVMAAALLAVEGLYLHRSMPVDEQTLGLLFVPTLAVVAAVAIDTGERRWFALGGLLLLALPATHNLDAIVAALALTALAALAVTLGRRDVALRGLLLAAMAWVVLVGYTVGVAGLTPARVLQSERILGVPGLFLAWVVLLVVGVPWLIRRPPRTVRTLGSGVFLAVFAVALVNAVVPVYPGTQRTPPVMAAAVAPLFVLGALAAWATPIARRGSEGRALTALVGGTLALGGLAFTAALTPDYLNLAYRTQTFLHLPVLAAAALGVVALARRLGGVDARAVDARRWLAVLSAIALVCAAASIPIAFGGLSMLSYKGVTTPAEYSGAQFASERVPGTWAGDNHVVRVTWGREDVTNASRVSSGGGSSGPDQSTSLGHSTTAPVYDWVVGGAPPPASPTVTQRSWSTTGAQFFPLPPDRISADALDAFEDHNHVVYGTAGTDDPLALVVPRATDAGGGARC